ncbi:MAG: YqjF family protein [Halolamina sp.]
MQRHYLSMDWRDALFVHWPVPADTVGARLPSGIEPRTHDGSAWLGIVAFVMEDIRPRGVPRALGLTFGEVNLRTYVRGPDGGQGIYFYNLDAADPLGVPVARQFYQLPYYRAEMDIQRDGPALPMADAVTQPNRTVRFVSHRTHRGVPPAHIDATYGPVGEPFRPEDGTLTNFLVENYRFYLAADDVDGDGSGGDASLYYGDVAHPPWDVYEADLDLRSTNLLDVNGFARPADEPLAHYSPGVPVDADRVRRLD